MRRRRSTYLPRVMRNGHHVVGIERQTDHPAVGTQRQTRANCSPPHHPAKIGTEESGVICTTFDKLWTVEQDTQDRSTDREDVPRQATTATYSDVTNLATPGPKTADELHPSCHDLARYRGAAHPLCFTNKVMDHEFPEGFKPVNIKPYDGTTDPAVWIEDFLLHIHMAHGDDLHMPSSTSH